MSSGRWPRRGLREDARDRRSTTDLDAVLDGVDAVYISTTNEKHKHRRWPPLLPPSCPVRKAARNDVVDAAEMVRAAEAAGLVFGTTTTAELRLASRDPGACRGRKGRPRPLGPRLPRRPPAAASSGLAHQRQGGGRRRDPDITVHDADTVRFHLDEDPVEVVAT
jgi:1,5-anhydro-D-fructose reductase (1,5-anhydro-D-mannitol-forming)